MNAAQYAKHRGVSRVQVHKYIKAGQITAKRVGNNYEIDPAVADGELSRNLNPATGGRPAAREQVPSTQGIPPLADSRAIREAYAARIIKLEYEEKAGKLVDKGELKLKLAKLHMAVRDALRTIPDRVAPILAAETNQAKIHAMLLKEIGQALEGLSDALGG
jgi:hypothetical protein